MGSRLVQVPSRPRHDLVLSLPSSIGPFVEFGSSVLSPTPPHTQMFPLLVKVVKPTQVESDTCKKKTIFVQGKVS